MLQGPGGPVFLEKYLQGRYIHVYEEAWGPQLGIAHWLQAMNPFCTLNTFVDEIKYFRRWLE